MNCLFCCEGETEAAVVDSLVRHVQEEHDEEWFDIEAMYEAARSMIRGKAA
jgi:predicted small metal-binding protein